MPHFSVNPAEIDELYALALHALIGTAIFKTKNNMPWVFYVVESPLAFWRKCPGARVHAFQVNVERLLLPLGEDGIWPIPGSWEDRR